jgi:hypothetical protein
MSTDFNTTYNLDILKTVFYCERNIINKDEHVVHGIFICTHRLKGHFRVWRDGERKLVSDVSVDDQLASAQAVPLHGWFSRWRNPRQDELNKFLCFFEKGEKGNLVLKLDIAARTFYLDNYATCARDAGRAIGWHLQKKAVAGTESVSLAKIWQRIAAPFIARGKAA